VIGDLLRIHLLATSTSFPLSLTAFSTFSYNLCIARSHLPTLRSSSVFLRHTSEGRKQTAESSKPGSCLFCLQLSAFCFFNLHGCIKNKSSPFQAIRLGLGISNSQGRRSGRGHRRRRILQTVFQTLRPQRLGIDVFFAFILVVPFLCNGARRTSENTFSTFPSRTEDNSLSVETLLSLGLNFRRVTTLQYVQPSPWP